MGKRSASSRDCFPKPTREMINNIKEIFIDHTEEDIYAVLKECSMDANEATERLLHLDIFHEVKSKHTKRKEKMNSQALKESRPKPGNQGHGCGSGKESSSSPYISHDAVHGMNTSVPTDNGVVSRIAACRKEDGVEADAKVLPHVAKSPSVISTAVGSTKVPHSSATAGEGVQQSSVASFPNLPKYDTYAAAVMSWSSLPRPKDNVDHEHSVSDLVSVPSCGSQLSIMVDTIKCYVESQWAAAVDPTNGFHKLCEAWIGFEAVIIPDKQSADSTIPNVSVKKEVTLKQKKLKFRDGQQYITPNQMQVPQAVKSLLQFGSLDASYFNNSESNKNSNHPTDLLDSETNGVPSSNNQVFPSIAEIGNCPDDPQTLSHLQEQVLPLDSEVSKNDTLKHEKLLAVASVFPIVQPTSAHVRSSRNQESPSTTDARNQLDRPQALSHMQEEVLPLEIKVSNKDLWKHEKLPAVAPTCPVIEPIPIYVPFSCKQEASSTAEKGNCLDHSQALSGVRGQVLPSQCKVVDNNQLDHEQFPAKATPYPFVQPTFMPGSPLLQPEELDPQAQLASSSSIKLGTAGDYLNNSESNKYSNHLTDLLDDEIDGLPSLSNQKTQSTGEKGNYPNHPRALPLECDLLSKDQLKHKLSTVAPSCPVVGSTPLPGSPLFQLEGLNTQAWISSPSSSSSPNPSFTGNSPAVPTVAPIPPPTQSTVAQSSIDVPPLPAVFWEPYPFNYIPGSHYYSPFNVLPALDQPFVYSGFPQQPTGNVFLPTPVTTVGTQLPSAPYNMGTITGDQSHEGAAVWTPTLASQETTRLPVNSGFNLLPQGHHISVGPHSGHGAFVTAYHPLYTVATTKTIDNPLLQQSQCMDASSVFAGPPPSKVGSHGNGNRYHHHYHHHHHHYHRHYHYGNKAYNHGSRNNDRHH